MLFLYPVVQFLTLLDLGLAGIHELVRGVFDKIELFLGIFEEKCLQIFVFLKDIRFFKLLFYMPRGHIGEIKGFGNQLSGFFRLIQIMTFHERSLLERY